MKKLLGVAIILLMLVSCRSSRIYKTETYFVDFRPYAEKGFLMTTQPITEKYQSIGEISYQCVAGYDPKNEKKLTKMGEDVYFKYNNKTVPVQCELSDVLNQLYMKAKDIGANGLVQLRIEYHFDRDRLHTFNDITVTGLAVKIEK